MSLDHRKELTPVLYDESAVKILEGFRRKSGQECFVPHWHERMELLFVVEGAISLSVGKQTTIVSAGELGVVPPSAVHSAVAGETGALYRVLMFDVNTFTNGVRGCRRLLTAFMNGNVSVSPCVKDTIAIQAVRDILKARQEKSAATPLFVTAQVYLLFDRLFAGKPFMQTASPAADERFLDVLSYIDGHFTEPLTAATLSARFGYTESYFCRRFKGVTGLSPGRYICIRRLEEAKRLMEDGMTVVNAVAAACGFTDSDYFARCFKKTYGCTPTCYITLQKENTK